MFLIFNHNLTPEQEQDARENLGIDDFITLPENLREIWSQIPADVRDLREILRPIAEYLETNLNKGDYALIQGDYGATFLVAHFVKDLGGIPVHATSRREIEQEIIGTDPQTGESVIKKIHRFSHKIFRPYFPEDY
jgi:hypothetical protein